MGSYDEHIPLFDFCEDIAETGIGDIEACKYFLTSEFGDQQFTVFQINVCSIKKNFDQVSLLLSALNTECDCIILTEARISPLFNKNLYQIDNYDMYHTSNHYRQNDGVVAYLKRELASSSKEFTVTDSNCLLFNFTKSNRNFSCLAIYRSPNGILENFMRGLPLILDSINRPNSFKILLGDININILNDSDNVANDYLNLMAEKGFTSYCNKPTRLNNCLDHLFINPYVGDQGKTFILGSAITDHDAVLFKLTLRGVTPESDQNRSSTYQFVDIEKLKDDLDTETWDETLSCYDANISANLLVEKLKSYLNKNTSEKSRKVTKNKIKTPWITEFLIQSIKRRDELHMKCRRQPFNTSLTQQFKKFRNKLNNQIAKAKSNYFSQKIVEADGNKRKIYAIVNDAIHYKSKKNW